MKTCWDILQIEKTTDTDAIRRAYLALLPSFHPETDPEGFKQLRQAYETAKREAQSPAAENIITLETESPTEEHAILRVFRELLASGTDRFQPMAWQRFIQQLNTYSINDVDALRWPLCAIAMETSDETGYISFACLSLLADRLHWRQMGWEECEDEEELTLFLDAVYHGDMFDFSKLAELPLAVQNESLDYFRFFNHLWFRLPEKVNEFLSIHRTLVTPDDERLHIHLLRRYTAIQFAMPELLACARAWRAAEPENEDAHYYEIAQRVYSGEGEELLPELCAFWQQYPSTQADALLLRWCFQHRPDHFPLLALAVEGRELLDEQGELRLAVSGDSAGTRLKWAEIFYSGRLSPAGHYFVVSQLTKGQQPPLPQSFADHPLWPLYQVAQRLGYGDVPDEKLLQSLLTHLDRDDTCPLEAILIRTLLSRTATLTASVGGYNTAPDSKESTSVAEAATDSSEISPLRIIFYILLAGSLLGKILHLFT